MAICDEDEGFHFDPETGYCVKEDDPVEPEFEVVSLTNLTKVRNHLSRAVYSMRMTPQYVIDVILKDFSWRVVLKAHSPYGYLNDLLTRLGDVPHSVTTGVQPYAGYQSIYGHFEKVPR